MPLSQKMMPATVFTAAGSKRKLDLRHLPAPTLLLFHDQHAAETATAINLAVRQKLPAATQILIGSVPDLSGVPRLFRGVAQAAMDKGYRDGATQMSAGYDPADYILILPDWDGSVTKFTGFANLGSAPGVLLVGQDGAVLGQAQGTNPTADVIELLVRAGLVTPG
ncbi:MAG: hypothetical protein KBG20_04705 [Caldilineaceae bacterium]|nr:hypothetical protein [Caldilineaceae bacterium]MBP8106249.1 hypothetical protein [Caldilineaceae bacterium]MBP8121180.1 hypothetical protein [Caldilineaceae bacterium]MBP9071573.1 hypothetical protein [Caldilineaceae bacterium]